MVGYVKGMARASTLMALVHCCWDWGVPLPEIVQQSANVIWVRRALLSFDAVQLAFENAKLSARGSIRKAHCSITWVMKLLKLVSGTALSAPNVIKDWNMVSTKDAALVGVF